MDTMSKRNRECSCSSNFNHGNDNSSCCCGHSHGHSHDHGHDHANTTEFFRPAVSFLMLVAGVLMNHIGLKYFSENNHVQLIWYITAFIPVGFPVIKEAMSSIKHGDVFNEFMLMTVACIGAFCIGEYPEAVGVMLFYCIGETLQHRAVNKATRNISKLLDVRGESVTVIRDGQYMSVNPKEVGIGEIMEIHPGERVPLDGMLHDGDTEFDTSALTGESVPRIIEKDGEVLAGMISSSSTVRIEVTREYGKSTLARILDLVNDAASRKAPAEQFIRKFARIYTPVVIVFAALLIIVPAIVGALNPAFHFVFSEWLYRALVFLVISCPCALVISVPLGYFAGIGAASKAGILFKGGNYLDAVTKIDSVAFDKTGTLTSGRFHIESIRPVQMNDNRLLSIIAAVETGSAHPIASAIVASASERNLEIPVARQMKEYSGLGAEAMVNGENVIVGNTRLLARKNIDYPAEIDREMHTIIACSIDGKYVGSVLLSDTLKEDSFDAVRRLRGLGIEKVVMLSGDRNEIVEDCASELGIDEAYGSLMPQDKALRIEQMIKKENRNVAFVGDGFNDAPVLAMSNVGIAMGGLGSDAAIESADVVIQTDQPSKVADAIRIGRYTRKIVTQNIVGAISIKAVILLLGAVGYASLWAAVFADVGVALLAVCNSMRILWHKF